MDNFAPGLRDSIVSLTDILRVVVFFIAVAGLILQVNRARNDSESLTRPLVRAILIVGLIATLPTWFSFAERSFLQIADVVNTGYTEHPMKVAAQMRKTVTDTETEFSLRRLGESLYKAVLWAAAKLVILVGSLLQLPFLLLQYLLKLLCYLFLPIALSLMLVPSLTSLGSRYLQQTLAVLAWPVGFAVTELVGYHLLTSFAQNVAGAFGLTPTDVDAASFASLLGGLLAALWIILGTIGTPFLMQSLICSGTPLNAAGGPGLQKLYTVHQLTQLIKMTKTGGASAIATAADRTPPPPPSAPPASPATSGPRSPDPTGDLRARGALNYGKLPTPYTTL
ncbi:MAG: hypothetical protein JNJ82_04345 [Opitutaceae bacterium]|nr:hypothetical protein [Opitutaceae bacterium]